MYPVWRLNTLLTAVATPGQLAKLNLQELWYHGVVYWNLCSAFILWETKLQRHVECLHWPFGFVAELQVSLCWLGSGLGPFSQSWFNLQTAGLLGRKGFGRKHENQIIKKQIAFDYILQYILICLPIFPCQISKLRTLSTMLLNTCNFCCCAARSVHGQGKVRTR